MAASLAAQKVFMDAVYAALAQLPTNASVVPDGTGLHIPTLNSIKAAQATLDAAGGRP
jgi:hypothetical protein